MTPKEKYIADSKARMLTKLNMGQLEGTTLDSNWNFATILEIIAEELYTIHDNRTPRQGCEDCSAVLDPHGLCLYC